VAVRLPRRSLLDPALPARVSAALAAAEVAADQLVVCVDDALPTATLLDVTEVVTALADRGAQIAVDRLSMLEQLPTLPVSQLRLPADLVSALPTSDRAAALVAGTIATASRLGLHTTARGVDTEAHAAALRDMGCRAGQGEHVALTVEGVKAGRYLWATGLLSEALHPPADVVVLARQRERRRRTT
jgi:EAL domain-containing protein (putative c-di-GMP-specific phosphodiesterase class I)